MSVYRTIGPTLVCIMETTYGETNVSEPRHKNKHFVDADQLHGNREGDQRLCNCYTFSAIPLLLLSEISSLYPSSVAVQPGLFRTRSKI